MMLPRMDDRSLIRLSVAASHAVCRFPIGFPSHPVAARIIAMTASGANAAHFACEYRIAIAMGMDS